MLHIQNAPAGIINSAYLVGADRGEMDIADMHLAVGLVEKLIVEIHQLAGQEQVPINVSALLLAKVFHSLDHLGTDGVGRADERNIVIVMLRLCGGGVWI